MVTDAPRVFPLIDLDPEVVRDMLRPVLQGAEPREIERVEGGLVNTVYRVTVEPSDAVYALRVYASDRFAFESDRALFSVLRAGLPVPDVLFLGYGNERCPHPYIVYRWIEGVTLNAFRRTATPDAFLSVAEPLGHVVARIARSAFPASFRRASRERAASPPPVSAHLGRAAEQLRAGVARDRLGDALADTLRVVLGRSATRLHALDRARKGLIHGDLGGRNVLVNTTRAGQWEVVGVIDWDGAGVGSRLWDLGSLFRYTHRYSLEFRDRFARGYVDAGGDLPEDWLRAARLLDATRLVAILSEERDLPVVFAECRELVEALVSSTG